MRVVIQRVSQASVTIDNHIKGRIDSGFLILLGIEESDTYEDAVWLTKKISGLRIFPDEQNLMNKSITDINGDILLISQFTLYADTKKGNRPSFIRAAKPDKAIPLYNSFIELLEKHTKKPMQTGVFGADMNVQLVNNGPVTIIIDTKDQDK